MSSHEFRLISSPLRESLQAAILESVTFHNVESNLRDSFRVLAYGRPSGEIREYPGVSIASVGVAFQMFNAAFLSAPVSSETELERRISQASVHFAARRMQWAYWVCESWLDEKVRRRSRHIFSKHGLHFSVELPGMIAHKIYPPARPLPPLTFRRVTETTTCADFCAIGSVCFNVPAVWFREVFEHDVWNRFASYVGYLYGEPVSTAAVVTGGGVAGVYNVATLPGHQRQGYGEAIMRHALAEAARKHGAMPSILQSTPQGYTLYERMGYSTVTRVSVYSS